MSDFHISRLVIKFIFRSFRRTKLFLRIVASIKGVCILEVKEKERRIVIIVEINHMVS